jgi:hypothetical protein
MISQCFFFALLAYLVLPTAIQQPHQFEQINAMLKETVAIPLFHDEAFDPHPAYDQMLATLKTKGLQYDKKLSSKALEQAQKTGQVRASLRRTIISDTASRLLAFLQEDPELYIPICAEHALAAIALCAFELGIYFANNHREGSKRAKSKDDFEDVLSVARCYDVMVRLRDALAITGAEFSMLYRACLSAKETKSLSFPLGESERQVEPAMVQVLRAALDLLAAATDTGRVLTPVAAQRGWTPLQITRLDVLRVAAHITLITQRLQPQTANMLCPVLSRVARRLVFADPALLASHVDALGASLVLYGNMHRLLRVVSLYIDSDYMNPEPLATLVRAPATLAYIVHPLLPMPSRVLTAEAAHQWMRTFVLFLVRKAEECLCRVVTAAGAREAAASKLPQLADAFVKQETLSAEQRAKAKKSKSGDASMYSGVEISGAESAFAKRVELDTTAAAQSQLVTVLVGLALLSFRQLDFSFGGIHYAFGLYQVLLYVTLLITVWSGIAYFVKNYQLVLATH